MLDWCRASGLAPGKRQQASAVQGLRLLVRRGLVGRGSTGRSAGPGRVRRGAGRRTPCAGRAVILTAVQSLRLLVRRGQPRTGLGQFLMGIPGYRFAPPRAINRSSLRDERGQEDRPVWGVQEDRPLWGVDASAEEVTGRMPVPLLGEGLRRQTSVGR